MAIVTTIVEESFAPRAGNSAPRAVSWGAIFAGATAAASLSLILLVLGMGLGLSALSPWASGSPSADAITLSAILWIAFAAVASSGLGGYIAGRLRESWPGVQRDEVYFRDTAHGFLAWAVATLLTAATLTSVIGAVVGTAAPAAVAGGVAAATGTADNHSEAGNEWGYAVDSLFRAAPAVDATGTATSVVNAADDSRARAEISRIFDSSRRSGTLKAEDADYSGQILSQYRGYPQTDAAQRVRDTYNATVSSQTAAEAKAKELAETARKQGARTSLWIFISLLAGAFTSSLFATFGGRQRDLP